MNSYLKAIFLLIIIAVIYLLKINNDKNTLIEKAKSIHNNIITLDTHCDIDVRNFTDSINYSQNLNTQCNIPKMESGGLDVAWFVVYTGQGELNDEGYEQAYNNAISKFNAIQNLVNIYAPEKIGLALTSEDVKKIHSSGKKVVMIGIENGYPIGLDIKNVEKFYDMGARYMSLAHNGHSQLSDSNTGESDGVYLHNGLSELGVEVIKEMNRLGIMIDISHPSKEAIRQMIEISKAPVIASHSSARTLCNHSRNLDDEQLGWIKKNGGVVQTVAFKSYLNSEKSKPNSNNKVDISDFVDHIDYLVKKIGINHVGISSDFDGGGGIEGWKDASETFNVTLELVERGYSETEIEKIWSGNLLRVLDEVSLISSRLKNL
ncbi:MAG: dipeptidase [Flavobacteriales bacterium]|tara:strand:- start:28813 stop:29940 length:1128 start_codon:yes stop_codon:yes gene_type:complete